MTNSTPEHRRRLVVWDVPEALEPGAAFRCRVGIKCEAGCAPAGWLVELRNHASAVVASAETGADPWPGTHGLYVANLDARAPDAPGNCVWRVAATAVASAADAGLAAHAGAVADVGVRVVAAADCRLCVIAVERGNLAPVAGARVVVHPFRAVTDADGQACLSLPRGPYRLFVSGGPYLPFRRDGELAGDATIRAELDQDVGPSDAELWS